jgi:hypothetical protein
MVGIVICSPSQRFTPELARAVSSHAPLSPSIGAVSAATEQITINRFECLRFQRRPRSERSSALHK